MKPILYIETNFAIGIARGQNPKWARLLEDPNSNISLMIPSVCLMEIMSNLESVEIKRWQTLGTDLNVRAKELRRDRISAKAAELVRSFETSLLLAEQVKNEIGDRFYDVLDQLAKQTDFIECETDAIKESLSTNYVGSPTDNLILCIILWHARRNPLSLKAFLSANTDDFKKLEVESTLKFAGIRYFSRLENALGWIESEQGKARKIAEEDSDLPDSESNLDP